MVVHVYQLLQITIFHHLKITLKNTKENCRYLFSIVLYLYQNFLGGKYNLLWKSSNSFF